MRTFRDYLTIVLAAVILGYGLSLIGKAIF